MAQGGACRGPTELGLQSVCVSLTARTAGRSHLEELDITRNPCWPRSDSDQAWPGSNRGEVPRSVIWRQYSYSAMAVAVATL